MSVKFIKAHLGDVVKMPISESLVGYGHLLAKSVHGQLFFVGAFETAYPADVHPDPRQVVQDRILFAVGSICDMVISQQWPVIGSVPPAKGIAMPRYRVFHGEKGWYVEDFNGKGRRATEAEVRRLPMSISAGLQSLSQALQAYHGVREWTDFYHEIEYDRIVALQDIKI